MGQFRLDRETIGFTPTMGALHEGHLALVRASQERCDRSVVSVFVNPTQFDDAKDLDAYPRPLEDDLALFEANGVDAVFVPPVSEVYPTWPVPSGITVSVGDLGSRFEGADRPGHFSGVATVVAILLNLTQADLAFFGEKDFQQLAIISAMAKDLAFGTEIIGVATEREENGLACSSRNARLSPQGHQDAAVIYRALTEAQQRAVAGASVGDVTEGLKQQLLANPRFELSYAAVVNPSDLTDVSDDAPPGRYRALVAGVIEGVRLLDNSEVSFLNP